MPGPGNSEVNQALEQGRVLHLLRASCTHTLGPPVYTKSPFLLTSTLQGGCYSARFGSEKTEVQRGALGRQLAFFPVNSASLFFVTGVIC